MTDPDDIDTTEKIERTDRGFRLTIDSTRGTGTRDQDEVKAEARTETLEELVNVRSDVRGTVQQTMRVLRQMNEDGCVSPDGEGDE